MLFGQSVWMPSYNWLKKKKKMLPLLSHKFQHFLKPYSALAFIVLNGYCVLGIVIDYSVCCF